MSVMSKEGGISVAFLHPRKLHLWETLSLSKLLLRTKGGWQWVWSHLQPQQLSSEESVKLSKHLHSQFTSLVCPKEVFH